MKRQPVTTAKSTVSKGVLLNIQQAAELLGTSERWIRRRVERKLLPHRRISGRIVFIRSELEQFIENLPGTTLSEAKQNLAMRNGEAQ